MRVQLLVYHTPSKDGSLPGCYLLIPQNFGGGTLGGDSLDLQISSFILSVHCQSIANQRLAKIASIDSTNCYDIIVHSNTSLLFQAVAMPTGDDNPEY